jgi:predicted O-methyltransferase YrrM
MTQRPSAPDELKVWSAVDQYYGELLNPADPELEAALSESRAAGLPEIQVSPLQGRFLFLLARLRGARRILEIGTLGGYSTIWLARALPSDGRLVTLEANPTHARVAKANLVRAGLDRLVEVRLGQASETLRHVVQEGEAPFDLVFIDADKPSYPDYLEWSLKLCRQGSVIVADNVVRRGDVVNASDPDPNVQGVRRMTTLMAQHPRLLATVIQTVGVKGYDGFALAIVT